jgi:hypothetical protein
LTRTPALDRTACPWPLQSVPRKKLTPEEARLQAAELLRK